MKLQRYIFLILFFMGLCALDQSSAKNYYMAPGGSDSNDGSPGAPWKTFTHVYMTAGPGDTVFVRGGEYAGEDMFNAMKNAQGGTPTNMLVIKAYPGDPMPVLNGFSRFGLVQYMRVEGLHFVGTGTGTGGVALGSAGNQLVNCTLSGEGFGFAAIHATGDNILVEGNTIDVVQSTTLDHGIYVQRGTGKVIRNNQILRCQGYCVHIFDEQKQADESQWDPFNIKDIVVENNILSGSESRDGVIVAKGRGGNTIDLSNITIRNNIITGNGRSAIFLREGTKIVVYNNTIYKNTAASIGITQAVRDNEHVNNVTVTNNIIVTADGNDHILMASQGANIVVDNNLYWPESGAISGITDAHALFADPKLMNPDAGDFHISQSSPALDHGVTLPSVTRDFEGSVRPQGDGYDIGADEFGDETVFVQLSAFGLSISGHSVKLDWSTAAEINNFGFEVQRRTDGTDFETIGFVPASEQLNPGASYQYWDVNLEAGRYYYRLKQIDLDGNVTFSGSVAAYMVYVEAFQLNANYPNPFNPTTEISFVVPNTSYVKLAVYNLLGQQVKVLFDKEATPGLQKVIWDGRNESGNVVPSGMYFYRLQAGNTVLSRRMILLK